MGAVASCCLLLVCVAVASVWTQAFMARCRSRRWAVALLGALGILAFSFSVMSPDDDLVQQEVLRPAAHSLSVIRHERDGSGGSAGSFPVAGLPSQTPPVGPLRGGATVVAAQSVPLTAPHVTPVSIHSPPLPL